MPSQRLLPGESINDLGSAHILLIQGKPLSDLVPSITVLGSFSLIMKILGSREESGAPTHFDCFLFCWPRLFVDFVWASTLISQTFRDMGGTLSATYLGSGQYAEGRECEQPCLSLILAGDVLCFGARQGFGRHQLGTHLSSRQNSPDMRQVESGHFAGGCFSSLFREKPENSITLQHSASQSLLPSGNHLNIQ